MKRIIVLILIIITAVLFVGCGELKEIKFTEQYTMVYITYNQHGCLMYDKKTKVMYYYNNGGVCVMLNADGTPKLYKGE